MKRAMAMLLALTMAGSLLVGCGSKSESPAAEEQVEVEETAEDSEAETKEAETAGDAGETVTFPEEEEELPEDVVKLLEETGSFARASKKINKDYVGTWVSTKVTYDYGAESSSQKITMVLKKDGTGSISSFSGKIEKLQWYLNDGSKTDCIIKNIDGPKIHGTIKNGVAKVTVTNGIEYTLEKEDGVMVSADTNSNMTEDAAYKKIGGDWEYAGLAKEYMENGKYYFEKEPYKHVNFDAKMIEVIENLQAKYDAKYDKESMEYYENFPEELSLYYACMSNDSMLLHIFEEGEGYLEMDDYLGFGQFEYTRTPLNWYVQDGHMYYRFDDGSMYVDYPLEYDTKEKILYLTTYVNPESSKTMKDGYISMRYMFKKV